MRSTIAWLQQRVPVDGLAFCAVVALGPMVSKNESARYFWARWAVFSAGVVVSRQPGGPFSSDGYVKLHRCSAGEVSGSRLLAVATRRATPDR